MPGDRKQKMREYRSSWQRKNREKASHYARDWQRRQDPNKRREARQERRFRNRAPYNPETEGLGIVTAFDEKRPPLTYIRPDGKVLHEDWLSAEQLIELFNSGRWRP